MASETHNSSNNSHNNTMGSHFTSLHNISHPNGEEFGTSSPHLPRYKISANPLYSASLIENEIGPPDGKPIPSAPVLATKPYSASSTDLTNYDKDEVAGKRAQILFFFGIVFPFLWIAVVYYFRQSRSKRAYKWRKFSSIGLLVYVTLAICVGWILLVIAFNLYKTEDLPFYGKTRVYYVYNAFKAALNMEFGELVCIVMGPILLLVVVWESVVSTIRYVFSRQMLRDVRQLFGRITKRK